MYELKKQQKMIRRVRIIKKIRKGKKVKLPSDVTELFIDTSVGKVRTLCYGFEKKEKEPVFLTCMEADLLWEPQMLILIFADISMRIVIVK